MPRLPFRLSFLHHSTLIGIGLAVFQLALQLPLHLSQSPLRNIAVQPSIMSVQRLRLVLFGDSITQQSFEAGDDELMRLCSPHILPSSDQHPRP